jgi:hypothetical protein
MLMKRFTRLSALLQEDGQPGGSRLAVHGLLQLLPAARMAVVE